MHQNVAIRKCVDYVPLVVQWGRAKENSMKPNTYLNSAECKGSDEPNFYDRKRIFLKT